MNQNDKKGFAQLFKGLCEYYGKNNLSKDVLKMYFGGLKKFSIDQVVKAAGYHMHDPEHGSFSRKFATSPKFEKRFKNFLHVVTRHCKALCYKISAFSLVFMTSKYFSPSRKSALKFPT